MSNKTIKIIVGGKEDAIDVRDFVKIVRYTAGVFDAINDGPRWLVGNASRSSPLSIELKSESEESAKDISTFINGMHLLNNKSSGLSEASGLGEASRPAGFDERALKWARRLVQPLGNGISKLTFVAEGETPVTVSLQVAASVDALSHAPSYEAYTELEGILGQILVHGGRAEFCIYDRITDKPTACKFNSEDAESVGALITHRVRVYGKARYSRKHSPKTISVDRWEGPIGESAPSLRDLHDAKFQISSGEPSEEIIRKLRALDG